MPISHRREVPKLDFALAITLGICIHSHTALAPAISAEKSWNSPEDDFSHSFQWRGSSLRESLCALGETGETEKPTPPSTTAYTASSTL